MRQRQVMRVWKGERRSIRGVRPFFQAGPTDLPPYFQGSSNTPVFTKRANVHGACHKRTGVHLYWSSGFSSQPSRPLWQLHRVSTMESKSQRPNGREGTVSALNAAIEALNLVKELSSITPAKAVYGTVSTLLATIRVCFPALLQRFTLDSHLARIRRSTN